MVDRAGFQSESHSLAQNKSFPCRTSRKILPTAWSLIVHFQKHSQNMELQESTNEIHNFIEAPICMGKERTIHRTQKPLKVCIPYIEISSNEGDLVLDPFMGSGTTAVACKMLKRNFIGFEINPLYCEIANQRLQKVE